MPLKFLLIVAMFFAGMNSAHGAWELQVDVQSAIEAQTVDLAVAENWQPLVGEEVFTVPNMGATVDGVPIAVQGISGKVAYRIGTPVRTDSSLLWNSESDELRAELRIDRIYAFKIERRYFNGGYIDLKVEGECRNVILSIPADAGARMTSQVVADMKDGVLQLKTRGSLVDWPQNAWQIDRLSCTGVEGFGEQVRVYALNLLGRPTQEIQAGLEEAIQKRLDSWATSAVNIAVSPQLIFPSRKDIVLVNSPSQLGEVASGQLLIDGKARLQLPEVAPGQNIVIEQKFGSSARNLAGSTETQIPLAAVRNLLMGAFFAKAFRTDFNSRNFKAFNELMQDRRAQSYAFPDLQRFSKNTVFKFRADVLAAPVIRNIRNADQSGVLLADVTLPLIVLMKAPRIELANRYVPYVQFQGNVRGTLMMRLISGQLALQMADAEVDLEQGRWSQAYVEKYKPDTKIRESLFAEALSDAIRPEVHLTEVPLWQINAQEHLEPVELAVDGERLRVFWEQIRDGGTAINSLAGKSGKKSSTLTVREKEMIFEGVRLSEREPAAKSSSNRSSNASSERYDR